MRRALHLPTFALATNMKRSLLQKPNAKLLGRRSVVRASDIMAGIAQSLGVDQMRDVAAYFAAQKPVGANKAASAAAATDIVQPVHDGSPSRGIASCDSCHGASRSGPEEAPVLAGQSASYLEGQLKAFASGARKNDLYARMRQLQSSSVLRNSTDWLFIMVSLPPPRRNLQSVRASPEGSPMADTSHDGDI